MRKYQIYEITTPHSNWYYCKQKLGPFWVTPYSERLRWDGSLVAGNKNPKCKRFKTKEQLLEQIALARQEDLRHEKYCSDMQKIKHTPIEIV